METRRGTTQHLWIPRPPEDRETVRRQQKELRRIRQRARRESMSEEQIEKRRERGRENYLQRKFKKRLKKIEEHDGPVVQPRIEEIVECTTAEQIMQQSKLDHAYQCQQREYQDEQLLEQTEKRKMMDPQKNRLTHVRRLARNLNNQMVNGKNDVRFPRLIHIKRQARMLSRVVGVKGNYFRKKGNFPDSISLVQEHAQILLDISRMNGHSSTTRVHNSGRSFENDFYNGAMGNIAEVSGGDSLDRHEDSEDSASGNEEPASDSEEVIAFLSDGRKIFVMQDYWEYGHVSVGLCFPPDLYGIEMDGIIFRILIRRYPDDICRIYQNDLNIIS